MLVAKHLREPRLADAGLAHDQHDLALAARREVQPLAQHAPLFLAADERRGVLPGVQALPECAGDADQLERLREAPQHLPAALLDLEQARHEPQRRARDEHLAGVRCALDARGDSRRLAVREHLGVTRHAHLGEHDGTGVHAHAQLDAGIARRRRIDQLERRTHGALRIVALRLRPAEVREQAVAEMLRHVAGVPRDHGARRRAEGAHHLLQLLGIHARSELDRADDVAEQDRQLTPLAVSLARARRAREVAGGERLPAFTAITILDRPRAPALAAAELEANAAAPAEALIRGDLEVAGRTAHGSHRPKVP